MITVKISVDPYIAEYVNGKFYDPDKDVVRFPSNLDIYVLIFDLLQKRPISCPIDAGNLEFALPDRRCGKDPAYWNWLSGRSQKIINDKLRLMMWAELHDFMDENKHIKGIQFKESVYVFMRRYGINAITEDALLKNYQRWRDKQRRRTKRKYEKKSISR
ncbi:MAG: hypothetical protein ACI304_09080 [Lepagella sp.]